MLFQEHRDTTLTFFNISTPTIRHWDWNYLV